MFFGSFRVSNNIFNHAQSLPPCLFHTPFHLYPNYFVSSFFKKVFKPTKCTLCYSHTLGCVAFHWRVFRLPWVAFLKKQGLCLFRQLPIASTSLLHAGVLSVLSIHRSWAYCLLTTLISYVQLPAVSRKNGFLVVVLCLRQLHSFLSPLPEPWEKDCGIDIPFRAEHSIVSSLLHPDQFGAFVFITIYCQRMLFWLGLKDALIYRYTSKSLRVSLIYDVGLTESQ